MSWRKTLQRPAAGRCRGHGDGSGPAVGDRPRAAALTSATPIRWPGRSSPSPRVRAFERAPILEGTARAPTDSATQPRSWVVDPELAGRRSASGARRGRRVPAPATSTRQRPRSPKTLAAGTTAAAATDTAPAPTSVSLRARLPACTAAATTRSRRTGGSPRRGREPAALTSADLRLAEEHRLEPAATRQRWRTTAAQASVRLPPGAAGPAPASARRGGAAPPRPPRHPSRTRRARCGCRWRGGASRRGRAPPGPPRGRSASSEEGHASRDGDIRRRWLRPAGAAPRRPHANTWNESRKSRASTVEATSRAKATSETVMAGARPRGARSTARRTR
jgi:hypothetical protein